MAKRVAAGSWAREVARWRRSGLSAAEYASGRGLKASTLTWWAWRLRREERKRGHEVALVPVEVVHDPTDAGVTGEWELITAEGHRLRGDRSLTPELVTALVAALVGAR
jgi:transposase